MTLLVIHIHTHQQPTLGIGGVYADLDFECLRPLDDLLNETVYDSPLNAFTVSIDVGRQPAAAGP